MTDPKRCPKCGQPHARCAAHVKNGPRKGQPCMRWPRRGATVCRQCGGNAPQVRGAGEQRQADEEAEQLASRLLRDGSVLPIKDGGRALQHLAGVVAHALEVLAATVDDKGIETRKGRAFLSEWRQLVREQRQLLEAMERLGIAKGELELEVAKVKLMAVALGRSQDAIDLDLELRRRQVDVFMVELRAAVPAEIEAAS